MSQIQALHWQAMDLAEAATIARWRGASQEAVELTRQAFEQEVQAATLVASNLEAEPTRSVLHRSAASLAIECGELRAVERLIATALSSNPPPKIAEELKDLLIQIKLIMFTREQLIYQFDSIFNEELPPLQYYSFTEANCIMRGREDSIDMVWGLGSDFRSPLHFWVMGFRTFLYANYGFEMGRTADSCPQLPPEFHHFQADFQRDLEEGKFALCKPLSWQDYVSLVTSCCSDELIARVDLVDSQSFVAAMQMSDHWNDIMVIAEFESAFLFLCWGTGA